MTDHEWQAAYNAGAGDAAELLSMLERLLFEAEVLDAALECQMSTGRWSEPCIFSEARSVLAKYGVTPAE